MRTGVVYKLTIDKYFIIGSTINLKSRKANYLSKLSKNKYNNPLLQNVFNKYYNGRNLNFEIIEENIPEDSLGDIETNYINLKESRVEKNKGGMNFRDGKRINFSQEVKDKMSESGKRRKATKEHCQNISKSLKGMKKPKGFGDKLKVIKGIPVLQYDLKGTFIKEWISASEAAREIKGSFGNIRQCCKGNRPYHKGCIWKNKE